MGVSNIIDNRGSTDDARCDVVFEVICEEDDVFQIPRDMESFAEWIPDCTVYTAIMKAMQFKPKVVLHLYDEGIISGGLKNLIIERIHPNMNHEPLDFMKIPKELWSPY